MARVLNDLGASVSRAWSWSAVLKGTFLALSLYVVLRYFGAALGVSTGDGVLDEGFAAWSVIAQAAAIGVGGVVGGYLIGSYRAMDGALAGLLTWAVSIVAMTTLFGVMGPQTAEPALWGAFIGAVLSAGAAVVGGIIGSQLHPRPTARTPATTLHGIGPGPGSPPPGQAA